MTIFVIVSIVFSPLAAACAFVITYSEYEHHYPTKKMPLQLAFQAAIFTFIFFMLLTLGIGAFFSFGVTK